MAATSLKIDKPEALGGFDDGQQRKDPDNQFLSYYPPNLCPKACLFDLQHTNKEKIEFVQGKNTTQIKVETMAQTKHLMSKSLKTSDTL